MHVVVYNFRQFGFGGLLQFGHEGSPSVIGNSGKLVMKREGFDHWHTTNKNTGSLSSIRKSVVKHRPDCLTKFWNRSKRRHALARSSPLAASHSCWYASWTSDEPQLTFDYLIDYGPSQTINDRVHINTFSATMRNYASRWFCHIGADHKYLNDATEKLELMNE